MDKACNTSLNFVTSSSLTRSIASSANILRISGVKSSNIKAINAWIGIWRCIECEELEFEFSIKFEI